MSKVIVDALEIIHVEHHHRNFPFAFQLSRNFIQIITIIKPRQFIDKNILVLQGKHQARVTNGDAHTNRRNAIIKHLP